MIETGFLVSVLADALGDMSRERLLKIWSGISGTAHGDSKLDRVPVFEDVGVFAESAEATILEKQRALLTELKMAQEEVVALADYSVAQKYSSLLIQLAEHVLDATSARQLVLLEMRLKETSGVLTQVKTNLVKRRHAFWYAAGLFAALLAVLTIGYFAAQLLSTGHISANAQDFSTAVVPFVNVPMYIVIWSAIGSCSAVLYRVNRSTDIESEDQLRLLMTQPIIGLVMGTISFLIIQLGFLTLSGDGLSRETATLAAPATGQRGVILFSFVAFLVGFSDRLADNLLRTLAGRFGGDQNADLVVSHPANDSKDTDILLAAVGQALAKQDSQATTVDSQKVTQITEMTQVATKRSHTRALDTRAQTRRKPSIANGLDPVDQSMRTRVGRKRHMTNHDSDPKRGGGPTGR